MFEKFKQMGDLMKQAKEMKGKMKEIQDELKKVMVSGIALSGRVKVTISGELECRSVEIDPLLLAPEKSKELQHALVVAFNEASKKSKDYATSKLSQISGGLNIPGLT